MEMCGFSLTVDVFECEGLSVYVCESELSECVCVWTCISVQVYVSLSV